MLKNLALILPGISITSDLLALNFYSSESKARPTKNELQTMKEFIQVVIPDSEAYSDILIHELNDDFYGFSKYLKYLIKKLDESAKLKFSNAFTELAIEEKKQIVEEGTKTGLIKKQVYNGAIYLLQLIVFAGLCDPDQSCQIIDFPGTKRDEFSTYTNFHLYNVLSTTTNGNPQ